MMPSSLASAASSPVPAPRLHVLVEEEAAAAAAAAEEGRDVLSPLPTTGGGNSRSSLSRAAAGGAQKQKRGRQTTTGHHHHQQQQRQIKVVARIRPLSAAEVAGGCTESVIPIVPDDVDDDGGTTSLLAGGNVGNNSDGNSGGSKSPSAAAAAVPKRFDYDAVLPSSADQRAVYERSVGDAVRRNVFRGYNTTIIAYGQTASGKTYTMNGPAAAAAPGLDDDNAGNRHPRSSLSRAAAALNESDGILPRAVHDLFAARRAGQREAKIRLSYLEIYNDAIRDLLGGDDDNGGGGGGDGATLPLLDDGHGVSVRGLSSIEVSSAGEARELMDLASLRRTTGVSGEGVWCACTSIITIGNCSDIIIMYVSISPSSCCSLTTCIVP